MISYERLDQELQAYVTNSGLPPADVMASMTLEAARLTVPFLLSLARYVYPTRGVTVAPTNVPTFTHACAEELGGILQRAGSDKSTGHNYHHLYAHILGTNDVSIPSNFGAHATPGSSVRAWRDFLPNAHIFGADIDSNILFQEDRIQTFFVDQTRPETFDRLDLPPLDLVIDDGLHSTHANLTVLEFGLKKIVPGGWIVIEDIRESSLPVWHLVAHLLPRDRYDVHILNCHWGFLFVVRRKL
jgi:hypothetical protein